MNYHILFNVDDTLFRSQFSLKILNSVLFPHNKTKATFCQLLEDFANNIKLTVLYNIDSKGFPKKFQQK